MISKPELRKEEKKENNKNKKEVEIIEKKSEASPLLQSPSNNTENQQPSTSSLSSKILYINQSSSSSPACPIPTLCIPISPSPPSTFFQSLDSSLTATTMKTNKEAIAATWRASKYPYYQHGLLHCFICKKIGCRDNDGGTNIGKNCISEIVSGMRLPAFQRGNGAGLQLDEED